MSNVPKSYFHVLLAFFAIAIDVFIDLIRRPFDYFNKNIIRYNIDTDYEKVVALQSKYKPYDFDKFDLYEYHKREYVNYLLNQLINIGRVNLKEFEEKSNAGMYKFHSESCEMNDAEKRAITKAIDEVKGLYI